MKSVELPGEHLLSEQEEIIAFNYERISPCLSEKDKRLFLAAMANIVGYGGQAIVARATGASPATIKKGQDEIKYGLTIEDAAWSRTPGGGRKELIETQPGLLETLETLIDPVTRGDPESPLRWTCKSTRILASELNNRGFKIGHVTVHKLLLKLGYSLKGNQKTLEGSQHPLRNEQFEFINASATAALENGNPVISVDTKKKEVLGNFANHGQEWEPKGKPLKVNSHDFPSAVLDRANPYGTYDLGTGKGFVNVGTTNDTPEFAVASIRAWWRLEGSGQYPEAESLLITADCGGSNSYRARAWKWGLQLLSNEIDKPICVCHFPPSTSKWNKIEHRLFSCISRNWRAHPLTDYETVVKLIRATETKPGLKVRCRLDRKKYKKGIKISNDDFNRINIVRNKFQGDWNYIIYPQNWDI